jgi:hypothetical protein
VNPETGQRRRQPKAIGAPNLGTLASKESTVSWLQPRTDAACGAYGLNIFSGSKSWVRTSLTFGYFIHSLITLA